ncbi:helix-turn-helix domain-containing protein [Arthrobacter roseus]|uniref:helix-turn-helix domain-containing protein n=1 Tax=Arthrobacter roseus TaxID=136274 RepID=UPI00196275E7|nr:helix-turn-helix transcriptional regulator [Arthrobacter roseus]MBM7847061.1 putative transcriptional regulator [Arthrobacter roseus]
MALSNQEEVRDATGEDSLSKHRIECHLDKVLEQREMTLTELSRRTGITMANLSILKTNKAKAVRFTTLTAICDVLDTTPAELITIRQR